jgi:hypothetical protein
MLYGRQQQLCYDYFILTSIRIKGLCYIYSSPILEPLPYIFRGKYSYEYDILLIY